MRKFDFRPATQLRIQHRNDFWLIDAICEAIDNASVRYEMSDDGTRNEVKNQAFRKYHSPGNVLDRRRAYFPEIKSAGYYSWDSYHIDVFHKTRPGIVTLWYDDEVDGVTWAHVSGRDPKLQNRLDDHRNSANLAEWFIGRLLYHIPENVRQINVYPLQPEPEW